MISTEKKRSTLSRLLVVLLSVLLVVTMIPGQAFAINEDQQVGTASEQDGNSTDGGSADGENREGADPVDGNLNYHENNTDGGAGASGASQDLTGAGIGAGDGDGVDGTAVPDTRSNPTMIWDLDYKDENGTPKTHEGSVGTDYYSNQPYPQASLEGTTNPIVANPGDTVRYFLRGFNNSNYTMGNWDNPRIVKWPTCQDSNHQFLSELPCTCRTDVRPYQRASEAPNYAVEATRVSA